MKINLIKSFYECLKELNIWSLIEENINFFNLIKEVFNHCYVQDDSKRTFKCFKKNLRELFSEEFGYTHPQLKENWKFLNTQNSQDIEKLHYKYADIKKCMVVKKKEKIISENDYIAYIILILFGLHQPIISFKEFLEMYN